MDDDDREKLIVAVSIAVLLAIGASLALYQQRYQGPVCSTPRECAQISTGQP